MSMALLGIDFLVRDLRDARRFFHLRVKRIRPDSKGGFCYPSGRFLSESVLDSVSQCCHIYSNKEIIHAIKYSRAWATL